MKIAVLKGEFVGNKLVFNIEKPVKEVTVEQLNVDGKFVEELKNLNKERYLIRKSREINKSTLSLQFRK